MKVLTPQVSSIHCRLNWRAVVATVSLSITCRPPPAAGRGSGRPGGRGGPGRPGAATRAPAVLDYGISTGWAGLYEITPDCNQIIDRSTEVQGLLIATGYSGHGFLMGPATGEIVRDLYHGKQPGYDIGSFALDRFARTDIAAGETNIV